MPLIRINRNPSRRQLAVFGLAWLVFLGLSGCASWSKGRHAAAEVLWFAAAVVPLAGLFLPRFLRGVYLALSYVTYPVGYVVSYVVLAIVYFLALAPIGLTMRLLRHDPLSRRRDHSAKSYWIARGPAKPAEDYFNQS
ncbi:MAG TPA: SxtJ family membrane protein [Opitutaceae bacterium]